MEPYITCEELTLGYDRIPVASGIGFTVSRGDYLCIIGENGSGKTTLLKTILGIIPPLSGRIIRSDAYTGIGYLPQQTDIQRDFPASAYEIVISGFEKKKGLRPFYNAQEKAQALAEMERLGITQLKDRSYSELSGGQQQRVLLARALCASANILLMDEPTTGLDPQTTADLYELILKLNKEGMAIIMISHDLRSAMKYATHILSFDEPVFYGTKKAFAERGKQAHE